MRRRPSGRGSGVGAEKLVLAAGLAHQLITVPRQPGSDCGFCLRFAWGDRDRVERLLAESRLGVERIVAL